MPSRAVAHGQARAQIAEPDEMQAPFVCNTAGSTIMYTCSCVYTSHCVGYVGLHPKITK